jgi:hypothetical protein
MSLAAAQIALDTDFAAISAGSNLKPIGRCAQTVAQSGWANNTGIPITFTTEDVDSGNAHNNVTNNTRITPTKAGWYRVHGSVSFAGQTDYTTIEVFLRSNGTGGYPPAGRISPSAANQTLVIGTTALILFNGTTDYVELLARTVRSGAGTSGTVVSTQFASVLEYQFEADQ